MIIGINCTKNEVALAQTSDTRKDFNVFDIKRYEFALKGAGDCADLHANLKTLLAAIAKKGKCRAVILSCSTGSHGSSLEAIKAEAIVELVCHVLQINVTHVKPQSLKSALGCSSKEKWQAKSKELFNRDGKFKYFNKGSDGAVAAAYKDAS
jgi:hypothetical protein